MPLIIFEWKVSFRLIDNNFMNLTRAIKLPSLFSSKSSTPAGACLLRLVIENFLEMMADDACLANSFSWCANSSSSEIGSSLKVCCDSIPTYQQLSVALPLFYLSGTFRSFLIKKIVLDQGANIFEALVSQEHVNVSSWPNTCANRSMKIFSQ